MCRIPARRLRSTRCSAAISPRFIPTGTISGQLKSGALRPIAIGAKKRFAGLPDVPTIPELGYTDYEAESWNGILAPAKMPKETLARLIDWFSAAGNSAPVKEKLGALGLGPTVLAAPIWRKLGAPVRAVRRRDRAPT